MGELLTGHRSELAYEIAKEISQRLLNGNIIQPKDVDKVRGIIQIKLEENRGRRGEGAVRADG